MGSHLNSEEEISSFRSELHQLIASYPNESNLNKAGASNVNLPVVPGNTDLKAAELIKFDSPKDIFSRFSQMSP